MGDFYSYSERPLFTIAPLLSSPGYREVTSHVSTRHKSIDKVIMKRNIKVQDGLDSGPRSLLIRPLKVISVFTSAIKNSPKKIRALIG